MRIAVVIPARNEAEQIASAVENALRAVAASEVVVVDGGSLDRTVDRARAAGAKVIKTQPGRARQLEAGWRATSAPVLLFLHADTRLSTGSGEAIRARLIDPRVAGGAFRLRFAERSPGLRIIEWGARFRSRWLGMPYGDQAIFVRRAALEAMGGIPQAPIMEDLDLVRGIRREGFLALLTRPATTSARRYRHAGLWRTWWRNSVALLAWRVGFDRDRVAAWYRR